MGFSVVGSLSAVIGGILIIVGIVLYCGTGGAYLPFTDYAIAVDVEPEESKVTLYKWNEDKQVVESGICVARNGIDDKIDKSGAFNHLLYCVQELASQVNSEHKTPVLLDAGSGLLLLADRNKTGAESILRDIDDSLKNLHVNNSQLTFARPKIVSGKDEALNAWIATNYLIQTADSQEKKNVTGTSGDTIGILDMGGVSAQIAYEVLSEKSNSEVNILGKEYFVQTSSNLCYGIHQALNRYYSLLIKDFRAQSSARSAMEISATKEPQVFKRRRRIKKRPEMSQKSLEQPKISDHVQEEMNEAEMARKHAIYPPNEDPSVLKFDPNQKPQSPPPVEEKSFKIPETNEGDKIKNQNEFVNKKTPENNDKMPVLSPDQEKLKKIIEEMESSTSKSRLSKRQVGDRPDVAADEIMIINPCANSGVEQRIKGSDLLNEICINNADGKPPTEHISANLVYKFVGSNEPEKCLPYLTKLTSRSECRQNFDKCALDNITVPEGAKFAAFSNYYKISRAIPELRVSPSISLEKYETSVKSFCSYPWSFVANASQHLCEANEEDCKNYCFGLQFIERTLIDLYNFGIYEWNNVLFIDKIHGTHLNWVLGDVLLASNKIPGAEPTPPVLPMYGLILMLVAGVVLLGYGLANLYTSHSKRSNYESV